jgi:hypothetical protein
MHRSIARARAVTYVRARKSSEKHGTFDRKQTEVRRAFGYLLQSAAQRIGHRDARRRTRPGGR